MKWLMLLFLFHLLLICSKCNKVINITSQDHLLQLYLCHHYNYTGDTTLLLLDKVYNVSGNGSWCTINTNYSLNIQGNHSMVTVQCISSTYVNTTHPIIGFAFTGSSSLTLKRVTFIGCGANLATLEKEQLDIINSTNSIVYFTQYHAAVLVFTKISYLVIRDVSISQYYGFAIVAVNLPNGTLDTIKMIASQGVETVAQYKNGYSVGSGVLVMYQDSLKTLSYTNQYKLIITHSTFSYNFDYIAYSGYSCITDLFNSFIIYNFFSTNDFSANSSLCLYNREGILCGSCSTNYSVVFGSTECRQCSNWWLWTLVFYAAAGPLLIYLLYTLKLILTTGTINGIIFYAQVANAGLFDVLSINTRQCNWVIRYSMKVALFLISMMNLDLGFPLCFYNGMNELWKAGLSLLFPLYLLIIVVVLIILSRFFLRISNRIAHSSVQVLVTVVHLSFSKLLLAIFDVFTPVQLYSSNLNGSLNVWFNDGSIIYGEHEHFVLMIVTSVIVGIFLIPYMLIILTGRLLMKSNKIREYLRPIYEAIHAPYKYNKQYWFTARQLLLIAMYIFYMAIYTNYKN